MAPMDYSPNEESMVSWKIVFQSGNRHGKREKNTLKVQFQSKSVLCIS